VRFSDPDTYSRRDALRDLLMTTGALILLLVVVGFQYGLAVALFGAVTATLGYFVSVAQSFTGTQE
jgi:hypothetical protein